jgi:hypothetical protein
MLACIDGSISIKYKNQMHKNLASCMPYWWERGRRRRCSDGEGLAAMPTRRWSVAAVGRGDADADGEEGHAWSCRRHGAERRHPVILLTPLDQESIEIKNQST